MNLPDIASGVATQVAAGLELLGVAVITATTIFALSHAALRLVRREKPLDIFQRHRLDYSRGVLLGLDFLVGADIVHTVAVELSSSSISALALVVMIRAFLVFSMEIEITGRFPWRRGEPGEKARPS